MIKRIICVAIVMCLLCTAFAACSTKLTAEQAYEVVLNDLGEKASMAGQPHIHEGMFGDIPCYNIYVTVGNENWYYAVTTKGEIVNIALMDSAHNH